MVQEPEPTPRTRSGDAYLVHPESGSGPGVLVLHSWWGLDAATRDLVERFADAGYSTLAPDLCDGHLPAEGDEARDLLAASDPNVTADLVLKSLAAIRAITDAPVAVVGFSMGASWALWAATRAPGSVDAVVAYYGAQNIDFDDLTAPVLGHFAEHDPLVTEDELVEMQARLLLSDKHVEVHRYAGTHHWFAEPGVADHYDAAAAELAWSRTLEFLADHHRR